LPSAATAPSPAITPVRLEVDSPRDDLTRPLPAVTFIDESSTDADVTAPLPRVSAPAAIYGSDADLTHPLAVAAAREVPRPSPVPHAPSASVGPVRLGSSPMVVIPPPLAVAERREVPLIVAVPRASVGVVEQSPSIQITRAGDLDENTPTSHLSPGAPRSFGVPRSSRGAGFDTLPKIPRAGRIPAEFEQLAASPSVVPVAGSIEPSTGRVSNRWLMALAALTFGALAVGVVLRPRTGALVVTVSGPSGGAVHGVSIRIDGTERCTSTPCEVADLLPGTHFVSAAAEGLSVSVQRALVLDAGEHAAHHVSLSDGERATGGLDISAVGDGLQVFVDGRDVGAPPVSLGSVEPGRHVVRIIGDARHYQPYEQTVKLDRGELRSLGPVRLRVLAGRLELRAGDGADGARVAVDGRPVARLPAMLELSPDGAHEVTATKRGFEEFSQQVIFDGTADQSVQVVLSRGGPAGAAPRSLRASSNVRARGPASPRPRAVTAQPVGATAGMATLDLNSIPRANVVINGRPAGMTPLRGVRVEPGKQTIVFVSAEFGRKFATASVAAGGRAAVGVKF
jgi:hypothetical protein